MFLILLLYCIIQIHGQSLNTNSYLGCYSLDRANREFNLYPGFIDSSQLTPQICIKACSAYGAELAAIESGKLCFCKMTDSISSMIVDNIHCQVYTCPGDSSTYCGSETSLVVYLAGSIVSHLSFTQASLIPNNRIPAEVQFNVSYSTNAKYLFVKSNNELVGSYLANYSSSLNIKQTILSYDSSSIELIASPSKFINSLNAKRTSFSTQFIEDQINFLNVTCSSVVALSESAYCTIIIDSGRNFNVQVDYGDGSPIENFLAKGTQYFAYGSIIQQFDIGFNSSLNNALYVLSKSQFESDGYLNSIELYVNNLGTQALEIYLLEMCNGTQCSSFDNSTSYVCSTLVASTKTCSSIHNQQLDQFLNVSLGFKVKQNFTVNVAQIGYNNINLTSLMIYIQKGWLIGIKSTANVLLALDSTSGENDYLLSGDVFTSNRVDGTLERLSTGTVMARITVSSFNKISVKKVYNLLGTYNIKVTLQNSISKYQIINTKQIQVQDGITGLRITTPLYCRLNGPCSLSSSILSGINVEYEWIVLSSNGTKILASNSSSFTFTFTREDTYLQQLTATNSLSRKFFQLNLTIIEDIDGVIFYSGNSFESSSVVSKTAQFLFNFSRGSQFKCVVNYNDFTQFITLTEANRSSLIPHIYTSEGVYQIRIDCSNALGTKVFQVKHNVQYELSGLSLLSKGALKSSPFKIQFKFNQATKPQIQFFIDNALQSGITYDESTGIGSTQDQPLSSISKIYIININASNLVSSIWFNDTFEVSALISVSQLSITSALNQGNLHLYNDSIQIQTNLASGSNVIIQVSTGDGYSTQNSYHGDWNPSNPFLLSYKFNYPGDYIVKILISNAVSSYNFNETISIVSGVDDLEIGLANSPLINKPTEGGAVAFYQFHYKDNSMAGSHAQLSFNPGDALVTTNFGPFLLDMDFVQNISKVSLSYKYKISGIYVATFNVSNPLGFKLFSLNVEVVDGIDGAILTSNPLYVNPGKLVQLQAYFVQAPNAIIKWFNGSILLKEAVRQSTIFSQPDTLLFQTDPIQTSYNLSIIAYNNYSSVLQIYSLKTLNNVSFNLSIVAQPNPIDILFSPQMTLQFLVSLPTGSEQPSDVSYFVDFNDSSPIEFPKPLLTGSSSLTLNHTFRESGHYFVRVTLFNYVSTLSKTIKIGLLTPINNFNCVLKWRLFEIDSAIEYLNEYDDINGVFIVRDAYNLRCHCSFSPINTPIDNITITWNKKSITYDISSLNKNILSSTTAKLVVVLPSIELKNGPRNDRLQIQASNYRFSTFNSIPLYIQPTIKQVKFEFSSKISRMNQNRTVALTYESLGEPSCALIWLTLESHSTQYRTLGTSKEYCSKLHPSVEYLGKYPVVSNGRLEFEYLMTLDGLLVMNFQIQNPIGKELAKTSITVSSKNCIRPQLYIKDSSDDFTAPKLYQRSKMIVLAGLTEIECDEDLNNIKKWKLFSINETNGAVISEIGLLMNPSSTNTELVIKENELNYGLYKAIYKVNMYGSVSIFEQEVECFFKVVPSGFVIYGIEDGIQEITRGTNQTIELNPEKYSFDIDSLRQPTKSLYFQYYCRKVINGSVVDDFPSLAFGSNYVSLDMYQRNLSIVSIPCFRSRNDFVINNDSSLLIKAKSLNYENGVQYQIWILAYDKSYDSKYEQFIKISIHNFNNLPIVVLSCKFQKTCIPYRDYFRINPNTQLMIMADCKQGCVNASTISYQYRVYRKWLLSDSDTQEKWIECSTNSISTFQSSETCFLNSTNIYGFNSKELTIKKDLFSQQSTITQWKIDFTVIVSNFFTGISQGKSSIIIEINKLPVPGECSVFPYTGTSFNTFFTINCFNWYDPDGKIKKYEFLAKFKDDPKVVSLGYQDSPKLNRTLPQGPEYDNYNLQIIVHVIDETDGIYEYPIPGQIQVKPNDNLTGQLINDVFNSKSELNKYLFAGNLQESSEKISNLVSLVNSQSFSSKNGYTPQDGTSYVTTFGPDLNMNYSLLSFDNLESLQPQFVGFQNQSSINNNTFEDDRNKRAHVRETLTKFLTGMSISDINSVKLIASVISSLTSRNDELSRNTAEVIVQKCMELTESIEKLSTKISIEDLEQVSNSILSCAGGTVGGLSTALNDRQSYLESDLKQISAPPVYYDTDLENYWSNPNNFAENGDFSQETMDKNKNIMSSKFQTVDATNKADYMIEKLSISLANHSTQEKPLKIQTNSLVMTVTKLDPNELGNNSNNVNEGLGKFQIPNFCSIASNDSFNCSSQSSINMRTVSQPMASSGLNGNNETKIGKSNSITLSFTNDNGDEIEIKNSKIPIDVWIPRDPLAIRPSLTKIYVSSLNMTLSSGRLFQPLFFNISQANASLHFELYPSQQNISYLVFYKSDAKFIYNQSQAVVDHWAIFCSNRNQTITSSNITKYLFFLNNNQINSVKGLVGIGLRELYPDEYTTYCLSSSSNLTSIPLARNSTIIRSNSTFNTTDYNFLVHDFSYMLYTSGCYYFDKLTGKWSSEGVIVLPDTNIMYTHCQTKHLTTFAGGLVVLPSAINWDYVFANADFSKNPTIYITVIVLSSLYIIFAVWGRYMDRQDLKKIGLCPLIDNKVSDKYLYEIVVFTGSRQDAGTDSKVKLIVSGEQDETDIRILDDPKRKIFRRGGVDSFIMTTGKSLGNLSYIRVWHDNSGKGSWASWYLKYIIIKDLQTKEKYYFLCQKWLAVEKDDGLIDRIIPVAGDAQKTEFLYLLSHESSKNMSDGHLWFSIFARPPQSPFNRLERVTCCFVLLFISMLMNILYYGMTEEGKKDANGINFGPFVITIEQISIGVITNLIIFPPSFLITELFRRSRRRISRLQQIKSIVSPNGNSSEPNTVNPVDNNNNKKKKKRPFTLPWWCKIIAFILSFIFMGVSIFFVISRGIEFGDEKVGKWLTSLVISFFSSVLLTQPIKVVLTAFFFVIIMKKFNDEVDIDDDDEENIVNENSRNALEQDEEWLYDYGHKNEYSLVRKRRIKIQPLTEQEVKIAKENRIKEMKMWEILRDLFAYTLFLWILFVTSYANSNLYSYNFQNGLKKVFTSEKSFESISSIEGFWNWTINDLSSGLRAGVWYDSKKTQPIGLAGFVKDKTSRMIGYGVLRQIRVKNNSCQVNAKLANHINFCYDDYSFLNEDKSKYLPNWSIYDPNVKPPHGEDRIYSAFKYRNSTDLNGYPFSGDYGTYWGGGYVYEMRGRLDYLKGNLTKLRELEWINRQTRAVFAEFSLYNPNINMFAIFEILIEFLPSGSMLTRSRIDPIILVQTYEGFNLLALICSIIYMAFIIYFMINEIRLIFKFGKKHFVSFWSLVEWSIISISWTAFALYLYRLYAAYAVLDFFKETSGYGYYKMQYVSLWNETLGYCFAFCAALGTLKFLKFLQFNKRTSFLSLTIKACAKELFSFSFMFFILYITFAQFMYLQLNKSIEFSTLVRSMTTCFLIALGKFDTKTILEANGHLGAFIFIFYNIFIVFILLNMFVSIISDAFTQVRIDVNKSEQENELNKFMYEKLKNSIPFIGKNNKIGSNDENMYERLTKNEYIDNTSYFPQKIDDLLITIDNIYAESKVFENAFVKKKHQYQQKLQDANKNRLPTAKGRQPPNRLEPIKK